MPPKTSISANVSSFKKASPQFYGLAKLKTTYFSKTYICALKVTLLFSVVGSRVKSKFAAFSIDSCTETRP
ncbi:unnamed protein product [Ixodes pacificus]